MSSTIYKDAMRAKGAADAKDFQSRSVSMTGTQMYAEEEKIPDFQAAKAVKNMLERPIGFICRSTAGRVVKLLQPYDSDIYTGEPEELEAQWGFKWSTDPTKALPFIQKAESTYSIGECCTAIEHVWSSKIDDNNWSPETNPQFWDDLGTIEEVMAQDWDVDEPEPEQPEPGQPEEGGGETGEDDPYKDVDDWFEPDSEHYYNKGDRMRYTDGHVYESLIDTNTYSPEAYPQGWKMLA